MSLSVDIDNKGKDILTYGKGPKQGLDDTTLTAEAKYSTNFSKSQTKVCIIIEGTVSYLLMLQKYISLK